MLAAGHFYASVAFLGWAAVLVATVTLIVIAAQFVSAATARALTYSLISDTALLSADAREKAGPGMRRADRARAYQERPGDQHRSADRWTGELAVPFPAGGRGDQEAQADDESELLWAKRVQAAAFSL